jgi:hypothetical protein
MRIVFVALAALCAGVPARGLAEGAESTPYSARLVVGVRSGYSWALGDVDSSTSLRDVVAYQIPVQLDVGLRFSPELSVGLYGSYGFSSPAGATKDTCDGFGLSCSANAVRGGIQLTRYYSERSERNPLWRDPRNYYDETSYWLSVGLGYDAIKVTMSGPGGSGDITATGFEAIAAAGFDFYTSPRSTMGFFVSASVARFTTLKSSIGTGSIDGQRYHEWITLGLHAEWGR